MNPAVDRAEGPEGREVCISTAACLREYRKRIESAWERQVGLCSLCGDPMRVAESTLVDAHAAHFWCHIEAPLLQVAS